VRLRDLVELVRAPAALSVPGDVVAGAGAAGGTGRARIAGLAAASVCLYWAGMAANDWADRDLDAVERPERPIPSGRVTPPAALGVAAGLTAAGLAVAGASGGRRALAVAGPLAAAVWAYDLRAKNTAAGPAAMAACRALDVLLGASSGRIGRAVPAALGVAVHTYPVTELSRREVAGARPGLAAATLATTAALAGAVALAPVAHPQRGERRPSPHGRIGALLAGAYAWMYGRAQVRVLADPGAARVRGAVGAGITSLPALQGALTARAGRPWAGLAVAAAAPVGRALARKVAPT
jgi:4-hydroxybenzoate polyprenyltransferase